MPDYSIDAVYEKELTRIVEEAKVLQGQAKELLKYWSGPPPELTIPGLVKSYQEAIKASKGLTSARPSCTKALSVAEKKPSVASLKAALKAVEEHSAEVAKEEKADKRTPAFVKALKGLADSLKEDLK